MTTDVDLLAAAQGSLPTMRIMSLEELRSAERSRPDIQAAILGRGAGLDAGDLDKMPKLAVVGIHGLSVAHCNPELLHMRGIALVNAESAYADSVAEFALGLIILGRRGAFALHAAMRGGAWTARAHTAGLKAALRRRALLLRPLARALKIEALAAGLWRQTAPRSEVLAARSLRPRELRGAHIGLIGWGANAHALTRRLRQAGASVLVYSEHGRPADIEAAGARRASLLEVLAAEVVSLHRGLTAATRHFLAAAELDKLQSGALLINVARGALIEPGALLARLQRGDIFACLDTYEEEPLAPGDPLRALPNVFLTPHIAGGSGDMRKAAACEVVQKVAACLSGDQRQAIDAARTLGHRRSSSKT